MKINLNFIFWNLVIFLSSLFLLSALTPNFIYNQFSRYSNLEYRRDFEKENIDINYLSSFKSDFIPKKFMLYDDSHGTNLSSKLLTTAAYTSPAIPEITLRAIKTENEQVPTSEPTLFSWLYDFVMPSAIWIALTTLTWVINNVLDSIFKRKKLN